MEVRRAVRRPDRTPGRRPGRGPVAAKVPEITALFWLVKLLTTGMGETASDYLGHRSLVLAGLVGVIGLVAALRWQVRTTRYTAAAYWSAVAMVAVFGTMAADALHVIGGIPYAASTLFYAVVLAAVFVLWHRREGTLSIHSITSRSRELWYWATVFVTFALGTAAGDFTAAQLGWGYLPSAVLFAALIAVPALAWWRTRVSPVATFWAAYVLTRPLGASIADWVGKPASRSGLGLGDGPVTLVLLAAIAVLVVHLAVSRSDIQQPTDRLPVAPGGHPVDRRVGVDLT